MPILRLLLLLILLYVAVPGLAQRTRRTDGLYAGSQLANLESGIREGDVQSLYLAAAYLDSERVVTDYLGYHVLQLPLRRIALRVIAENTLFTDAEIMLDNELGAATFRTFVERNRARISFSRLSGAFLITPESGRVTSYQLQRAGRQLLAQASQLLRDSAILKDRELQLLLRGTAPEALLALASRMYRQRSRWGGGNTETQLLAAAITQLTGLEIAVPDSRGTFLPIRVAFDAAVERNHWSYWAAHYRDFKWSDSAGLFLNTHEALLPVTPIQEDLALLNSLNTDTARAALQRLCESNPLQLRMQTQGRPDPPVNITLASFQAGDIASIARLTAYWRSHAFSYKGSVKLGLLLDSLRRSPKRMPGDDALENYAVGMLRAEDAATIEFHLLLHPADLPYGDVLSRALDRCYGRDWNRIRTDDRLLSAYLKLCGTLRDLRNDAYAGKFWQAPDSLLLRIDGLAAESRDTDVIHAAQMIRSIRLLRPTARSTRNPLPPAVPWNSVARRELRGVLAGLGSARELEQMRMKNHISALLTRTTYESLPAALEEVLQVPDSLYDPGSLLFEDYGISYRAAGKESLRALIRFLKTHTERQMYEEALRSSGMDVWKGDGQLDPEKVLVRLKYGEARGPSGYGEADNIFPLIKTLEYRFGTTLGYTRKRGFSAGNWQCPTDGRALDWIAYLRRSGLLPDTDPEPPSFKLRLPQPGRMLR